MQNGSRLNIGNWLKVLFVIIRSCVGMAQNVTKGLPLPDTLRAEPSILDLH